MSARGETLSSSSSDSELERLREKEQKRQTKKRKHQKSATAEQQQPSKRVAKVQKEDPKPTPPQKPEKSDGDERILLGRMRFVTVRSFKNKAYIDIREFYEKDGDFLPGKKGISLNPEQWQKLKENIDEIDEKLQRIC